VFDYETFYGTIRLHSTLRHLSPVAYENITMNKARESSPFTECPPNRSGPVLVRLEDGSAATET
jgi:hypothetical protein